MFSSNQPPIEGATLVATVYNLVDATIIEDLLKSAGIPSLRRARMRLDPLPVLAGFSKLGEEIYVNDEQADEAREIIAAFTRGDFEAAPGEENGDEQA